MRRKNTNPRILDAENAAITQFLFDRGKPAAGEKLPLQEIFKTYREWRRKNSMPPTALTLDGFGRLFPHVYPRGPAYWGPAGHSLKCVFGLGLKVLVLAALFASPHQASAFGSHTTIGPVEIPRPLATATFTPAPAVTPTIPTSVAITPTISIGTITGATDREVAMIHDGLALANAKMASPCFKQWVLAASYTENNSLTQEQIWDLMVRQPVTLDVEMYTGGPKANYVWKTVGFENDPWDGVVHMNRHFVNTAFMVADNLWHEGQGHSQGFRHDRVKATSDPYGMNYAGEGCSHAQQMQAKGGKAWRPPGIRLEIRHVKKK